MLLLCNCSLPSSWCLSQPLLCSWVTPQPLSLNYQTGPASDCIRHYQASPFLTSSLSNSPCSPLGRTYHFLRPTYIPWDLVGLVLSSMWADILCKHKVYELVDLSKGHKVIDNWWVFDVKPNDHRCACLVTKDFSQVRGVDFDTVQLLLALIALENWHIESLNVHSTYLCGKLTEEIYMKQFEGFRVPGQEHKVLRLLHALYGLKQAGLTWWETLNESMKELEFEHLKSDAGIFLYQKQGMNIVVTVIYVDDTLFWGPIKAIVDEIKGLFMKKLECRDLGSTTSFVNIWIKCKGHKILIDQCLYLKKVLEHFGMQNAKTTPILLPQDYYLSKHLDSVDPELQSHFQQVIGSLLHVMLGTYSDVAYAVAALP